MQHVEQNLKILFNFVKITSQYKIGQVQYCIFETHDEAVKSIRN